MAIRKIAQIGHPVLRQIARDVSREELAIVWRLRRVLSGLESLQALEMLLDRLRRTQSNAEFLMAITKSMPAQE